MWATAGRSRRAHVVRARSADGRWVRARAEEVTLPDGQSRGVAVVIDAARAGDMLPLAARAYQLSGRELDVVRGVLLVRANWIRTAWSALGVLDLAAVGHLVSG